MASVSGTLKGPGAQKRVLQLWVHDAQTSQEDILLNQETFPNLKGLVNFLIIENHANICIHSGRFIGVVSSRSS